jgi:periplasmic protein TonB
MEEEIIPITRPEEIQPPPPPPPPQVTEVLNIVEDDVDIDDELFIDDVEARADTRIDFSQMVFEEEEEVAEQEIFFIVEDMPDFQGGGQDAFRKYIAENLRYPQIAAENGIQGRVFVQFVVNADGQRYLMQQL